MFAGTLVTRLSLLVKNKFTKLISFAINPPLNPNYSFSTALLSPNTCKNFELVTKSAFHTRVAIHNQTIPFQAIAKPGTNDTFTILSNVSKATTFTHSEPIIQFNPFDGKYSFSDIVKNTLIIEPSSTAIYNDNNYSNNHGSLEENPFLNNSGSNKPNLIKDDLYQEIQEMYLISTKKRRLIKMKNHKRRKRRKKMKRSDKWTKL